MTQPLKIIHPASGSTVGPNFPVLGRYEYPNNLVASVFRALPLPALFFAQVRAVPHPAPAGTWVCHFFLESAPPGKYILGVVDPTAKKPTALYIPILIKHVKKKLTSGGFPAPSYPTAGISTNHTTFHSEDTAYGTAEDATPPFSSHFAWGMNTHLGEPQTPPPDSPPGYWAHYYTGVPTSGNPKTFHIQDSALPINDYDADYIDIIPVARPVTPVKKKGKPSGKRRKRK